MGSVPGALASVDVQDFAGHEAGTFEIQDRIDDFLVTLTLADGSQKTFTRSGATPAIQITDPLEGHKQLWRKMTDKDIHDVTAYLVTLK